MIEESRPNHDLPPIKMPDFATGAPGGELIQRFQLQREINDLKKELGTDHLVIWDVGAGTGLGTGDLQRTFQTCTFVAIDRHDPEIHEPTEGGPINLPKMRIFSPFFTGSVENLHDLQGQIESEDEQQAHPHLILLSNIINHPDKEGILDQALQSLTLLPPGGRALIYNDAGAQGIRGNSLYSRVEKMIEELQLPFVVEQLEGSTGPQNTGGKPYLRLTRI